jgi:aryl-alcohol dehydrogenase-like predicted oxidoreductase
VQATAEGTARYGARFREFEQAGFYRTAQGLRISSLGIGTYLGQPDEATDRAYADAVREAVTSGVNFIDTAINYRHQRSERSIGLALREAEAAGGVARDQVVVATKAGFLTPGAVPEGLAAEDVVGRIHSMAPDFLADQIERSRANLGLDTIDIFYLHNPETQLGAVSADAFEERLRRAFARLEEEAAAGRIEWYGAATWDGFRKKGALDLARMAAIAGEVAGAGHRFRFIQLPFNLGMVEAFVDRPESVLETAARLGVTVVASATLMQTRILDQMPEAVAGLLPGLATDAQRAIQFTRSTPGVAAALVGMKSPEHVRENLGVARVAPATPDQYAKLYQ